MKLLFLVNIMKGDALARPEWPKDGKLTVEKDKVKTFTPEPPGTAWKKAIARLEDGEGEMEGETVIIQDDAELSWTPSAGKFIPGNDFGDYPDAPTDEWRL